MVAYTPPFIPYSTHEDMRYEIRENDGEHAVRYGLYFEGHRFGARATLDAAELGLWQHQLRNAKAVDEKGARWVEPGNVVTDHKGRGWIFHRVSRMPIPGKSAKIEVFASAVDAADKAVMPREYYADGFGIKVRAL